MNRERGRLRRRRERYSPDGFGSEDDMPPPRRRPRLYDRERDVEVLNYIENSDDSDDSDDSDYLNRGMTPPRDASSDSDDSRYSRERSPGRWIVNDIQQELYDKISDLERKVADSRRETRQKDLDNQNLKEDIKESDHQIRKLTRKLRQNDNDLVDYKYKYRKAKDAKLTLEEDNNYLSDVVQQYYCAKEYEKQRRLDVESELEEENKKNRELMARIQEIENGQQYLDAVEKERKRADNYRNMMLRMMQQTERDGREGARTPPVWKTCEICLLEYGESRDLTPRVLGCGHTLCNSCAQQLTQHGRVRCPFDRSITQLAPQGVTELPKNYAVLQM